MGWKDISGNWVNAFKDKKFILESIFTVALLIFTLSMFAKFLLFIEGRPGVILNDPVLRKIHPVDMTYITFTILYACLPLALLFLIRYPKRLMIAIQSYILLVIFRIIAMYLTPLEAAPTLIALKDPLVEFFGTGITLKKDLFFSGHTSIMFIFYLVSVNKFAKNLFLAGTVAVGALVVMQHVHYSIDVFIAPFIAYCSYRIVINVQRIS